MKLEKVIAQILGPLKERRDYTPHGKDVLEQNAKILKKKKRLPKELEDFFNNRTLSLSKRSEIGLDTFESNHEYSLMPNVYDSSSKLIINAIMHEVAAIKRQPIMKIALHRDIAISSLRNVSKKFPKIKNIRLTGGLAKHDEGEDIDVIVNINENDPDKLINLVYEFIESIQKETGDDNLRVDVFIEKNPEWDKWLFWRNSDDFDEDITTKAYKGDKISQQLEKAQGKEDWEQAKLILQKISLPEYVQNTINKWKYVIISSDGKWPHHGYWNRSLPWSVSLEKAEQKVSVSKEDILKAIKDAGLNIEETFFKSDNSHKSWELSNGSEKGSLHLLNKQKKKCGLDENPSYYSIWFSKKPHIDLKKQEKLEELFNNIGLRATENYEGELNYNLKHKQSDIDCFKSNKHVSVIKRCPKKDLTDDRPESEQQWCLYTKDESRLLGRHPSKDKALQQERVIQIHKHQ